MRVGAQWLPPRGAPRLAGGGARGRHRRRLARKHLARVLARRLEQRRCGLRLFLVLTLGGDRCHRRDDGREPATDRAPGAAVEAIPAEDRVERRLLQHVGQRVVPGDELRLRRRLFGDHRLQRRHVALGRWGGRLLRDGPSVVKPKARGLGLAALAGGRRLGEGDPVPWRPVLPTPHLLRAWPWNVLRQLVLLDVCPVAPKVDIEGIATSGEHVDCGGVLEVLPLQVPHDAEEVGCVDQQAGGEGVAEALCEVDLTPLGRPVRVRQEAQMPLEALDLLRVHGVLGAPDALDGVPVPVEVLDNGALLHCLRCLRAGRLLAGSSGAARGATRGRGAPDAQPHAVGRRRRIGEKPTCDLQVVDLLEVKLQPPHAALKAHTQLALLAEEVVVHPPHLPLAAGVHSGRRLPNLLDERLVIKIDVVGCHTLQRSRCL
mmetsp:Transcript_36789/g.105948  ORF Transcript_36789/g.105948 Transcript_36789/m.105948 type:complete len:431 (+) Transcript_36789:262-1554(+)